MNKIGYSTGSISKGNYKEALELLQGYEFLNCVELSALREEELENLINDYEKLDLKKYMYVSIHIPSKLVHLSETNVINILKKLINKGLYFVVHPDIISKFDEWKIFGEQICIENMDKRKYTGRTVEELEDIFQKLPDASFCFDIAHSRQVDSSMLEAVNILEKFSPRLKEIHISEVNSESKHETLSMGAVQAYQSVADMISQDIPIIIESLINKNEIEKEVRVIEMALNKKLQLVAAP